MKLNSFDRKGSVTQPHNFLCFVQSFCRHHQTRRKMSGIGDERMVAHYFEFLGKSGKNSFSIMRNNTCFSMHGKLSSNYFSSKKVRHSLHSKTYSEYWGRFSYLCQNFCADTKICRIARISRSGRNDNVAVLIFFDLVERNLIISFYFDLESFLFFREDFTNRLVKVESERIEIV